MTKRSTNEEKLIRIERAADLLAEGNQPKFVVKMLASEYNVSLQMARDYVREGKEVMINDINPKDRAFMFAQAYNSVLQDRLDAREANNLNVQSGSTKSLIKLVTSITTLDQVGSWDSAREAEDNYLFRNFSEVKNKKVRHSDLDALDSSNDSSEIPF